jgi:hypothetical protein
VLGPESPSPDPSAEGTPNPSPGINSLQGPQSSTIDDVLPLAVIILIALGVGGAVLYRRRPTGV